MNTVIRHIVSKTYKPLLEKYLSKTRIYRYKDTRLEISPQVFHPGFFFSTHLLLEYISKRSLKGKRFLELGCGSGLISIVAAKQEAYVTATDINPVAIEFLEKNSVENAVELDCIQSDLFREIPEQQFDMIAINPPYYKKDPLTDKDHAWLCGEHGQYFSRFFSELPDHIHAETEILMVLCAGCDMYMINGFAAQHGFALKCVHSKQNIVERNFIFKIEKQ